MRLAMALAAKVAQSPARTVSLISPHFAAAAAVHDANEALTVQRQRLNLRRFESLSSADLLEPGLSAQGRLQPQELHVPGRLLLPALLQQSRLHLHHVLPLEYVLLQHVLECVNP